MPNERERELQNEINRLHEERERRDNARWDEIKELLGPIPEIQKSVEETKIILNGPPSEPEKGLKVRVDRLEQSQSRRDWWNKTIVGALLASIATSIWMWFKGLKGP